MPRTARLTTKEKPAVHITSTVLILARDRGNLLLLLRSGDRTDLWTRIH